MLELMETGMSEQEAGVAANYTQHFTMDFAAPLWLPQVTEKCAAFDFANCRCVRLCVCMRGLREEGRWRERKRASARA